MKKYELLLLIHPDLESAITKVTDKFKAVVQAKNGKIVNEDVWGKRALAYPVNKQNNGVYVLYLLELEPTSIREIENELRVEEGIMRFLFTAFEEIPEKQKIAAERKDEEREPERESAPRKRKTAPLTEKTEEAPMEEGERRKKLDEKLADILNPTEKDETEKVEVKSEESKEEK